MIRNIKTNKIMWIITAVVALITSAISVFNTGVYNKIISNNMMPGVFGQDLITVAASIVLLVLAATAKKESAKKVLIIFGILGYFFYAYGIYIMERVYTLLYYPYLVIFGLSFWSLVYGIGKIDKDAVKAVQMQGILLNISAYFCLFIAAVFTILWIVQLLPLITSAQRNDWLYSIYILDLCFIMPAFSITAVMALKKMGLGILLIPAMFILGFTLIFSLAVDEVVKPLYGSAFSIGGLLPPLILSLVFWILAVPYLMKLKMEQ
jgi:hypothetical protein